MKILVTGGAGYIGTHTCVELLQAGYELVILDNFVNSKPEALVRIEELSGKTFKFYEVDLLDYDGVEAVFRENKIDAVIHFAGLKAVGESVAQPVRYYHNNLTGTLHLCDIMARYEVKRLVFSSSATVYGTSEQVPLHEDLPLGTTNPYGTTKLFIEQILKDLAVTDPSWSISLLRYFNPVGAHASGRIGEDPNGIPNNLMPFITQVAVGKRQHLNVYGDDYNTPDGTGVRDYIHVVDLAKGHLKAVEHVLKSTGVEAFNLGTGIGYSVLDVVKNFEAATGVKIPYVISARRPGDIGVCYADASKALNILGWKTEHTLLDMCRDSWQWQKNNPHGYDQTVPKL